MKKIILILAALVSACSYVPPEAVPPIAELCAKYGMKVHVSAHQISCWKSE